MSPPTQGEAHGSNAEKRKRGRLGYTRGRKARPNVDRRIAAEREQSPGITGKGKAAEPIVIEARANGGRIVEQRARIRASAGRIEFDPAEYQSDADDIREDDAPVASEKETITPLVATIEIV